MAAPRGGMGGNTPPPHISENMVYIFRLKTDLKALGSVVSNILRKVYLVQSPETRQKGRGLTGRAHYPTLCYSWRHHWMFQQREGY